MSRSLVIARVGAKSLHRCWVDHSRPRDWDLYLCPFQVIGAQDGVACTVGDILPGAKWTGLSQLLTTWDGWRDYDEVWLPDDDIFTTQDAITAMFDAGRAIGFDLYAPALHENSHYAHYVAMRNRRFFARRVGFVEIMVPCFRREILEQLLPTLALSKTGWGWGLDSAWPKLLGYRNLGIVDAVSVLHTRAVGQFRDADLGRRVREESDVILSHFDCGQRMTTFGAIGDDRRDLPLQGDDLLRELVRGWDYLFDRNPRVLSWIMNHQRSLSEAPPYDIAGSPTSPA